MKTSAARSGFALQRRCASIFVLAIFGCGLVSHAGFRGGFRQPQVGGVLVDAEGLLRAATVGDRAEWLNQLRAEVAEPAGDLADPAELRMVSLRRLQDAIRQVKRHGKPLPDEMTYLAGLQRVEYVFVYPERGDIVLAGPAEPWKVRNDASVVGVQSGRPSLLLEDLMVALQSVETARPTGGVACSIEPTAEGRQRLTAMLRRIQLRPQQNPAFLEPQMREAFGPQQVILHGIAKDTRMARVLVAADFEMKRIAMQLIESPLKGLPSYLQLAKNSLQASNSNPRWWMTTNYDAVQRTEDRMAWQISGQGVKTLTETDVLKADGTVERTGRSEKLAEQWALKMTAEYENLMAKMSIFGDLRNVMDLSLIATLIVQEDLQRLANCDLAVLMGSEELLQLGTYGVPTAIEPACSFVKGNKGWVVTASGGVSVNTFEVLTNQVIEPSLSDSWVKAAADQENERWWWNG